jgi:pimeloyl-ACP methyl ester carboxylesterase
MPVVLAHGLTDSGACWPRLFPVFAARYDVVAYDARGHGQSSAPDRGYTIDDRVADLVAVLEGLGLDRPALVGHSMGADTAARVAALHPGLTRGVVLEDPPWRDDDTRLGTRVQFFGDIMRHQKESSLADLIAEGKAMMPDWDDSEWAPWAEAKHQVSPDSLTMFDGLRQHWRESVASLRCPAVLLTGDASSALVTPAVAAEAAGLCPSLTVRNIEGAGHNIRRERWEPYLQAVTGFLAEVDSPA